MRKVTKLPPANCYSFPYSGYGQGSNNFYKELRANKESWRRFRTKLLASQNYRCAYCKTSLQDKRMNVEHILAIKRGGRNNIDNIVAACAPCNKAKGNSLIHRKQRPKIKTEAVMLGRKNKTLQAQYRLAREIRNELDRELGYKLKQMFRED